MEKQAPNPWVKIPLSAYESHMRQASVGQLQAVNALMAAQFALGPARTAMVLGVACVRSRFPQGVRSRRQSGLSANVRGPLSGSERYIGVYLRRSCGCGGRASPGGAAYRQSVNRIHRLRMLSEDRSAGVPALHFVRHSGRCGGGCRIRFGLSLPVRFRRSGSSASSGGRIRPGSRVTLRRLSADRPGRSAAAERKEIGAAGFCRDGCRGEWPPK